jgi:hypothetical protein
MVTDLQRRSVIAFNWIVSRFADMAWLMGLEAIQKFSTKLKG